MGEHIYKLNDRVRRTAVAGGDGIAAGAVGTVVVDDIRREGGICVSWQHTSFWYAGSDAAFPIACLEPADGPRSAPVERLEGSASEVAAAMRAAPVAPPAHRCDELREKVAALESDKQSLLCELGDVKGALASERAQVRRLQVALDAAQRRARR